MGNIVRPQNRTYESLDETIDDRSSRNAVDAPYSIAGIVVLFQPDESVIANVKSYKNQFDCLLLIDNSPSDNVEMFEQLLNSSVEYFPLMSNRGIAHALNVGFSIALSKSASFVVTLDQDSSFANDVIAIYRTYIDGHDMANVLALVPQYLTDRNTIKSEKHDYCEVKNAIQSGSLFRAGITQEIGLFNEGLFLDVVDWEFFVRGRERGLSIIKCNNALLNHQPAITAEKRILFWRMQYGVAAPVRYYYQIRNLLWTAIRYRHIDFFAVSLIKWAKIILLFDNKTEYIRYGLLAIGDAMHGKLGPME